MFDNPEIDNELLPHANDVDWQPMDDKFVQRLLVQAVITVTVLFLTIGLLKYILTVALADDNPDLGLNWLWLLPTLLVGPLIAWPFLSVPRMGFALRTHDILYKSGVIWHSVTAIPFNRIQHVEKSSTPLDRLYRLSSLQLFTAGGSGGDLKIHGLPAHSAEDIRSFILARVGRAVEQA